MLKQMFIALFSMLFAQVAIAQDTIPSKRLVYTSNTDFVGPDLQQLFDTDVASCRRACLASSDCVAFTFNTRSNSCFPKKAVEHTTSYDGAISARVIAAAPEALTQAKSRAGDLAFLDDYDLTNALQQAITLGQRHPNSDWDLDVLREAARSRSANSDNANAKRWMGVATAISDDPNDWLSYGRYALAIKTQNSSEKRKNLKEAYSASINSYLRSGSKVERTNALLSMAEILERLGRGQRMIPALKLANALDYRDRTSKELERARAKYGFRIVNTVVESNSISPKICAEFSEPLAKSTQDYARFVALPDPRFAVEASGKQLCISGVEHGASYEVNFRSGLPAQSGESLPKDTRLSFYVRDRAPEVRFPGLLLN